MHRAEKLSAGAICGNSTMVVLSPCLWSRKEVVGKVCAFIWSGNAVCDKADVRKRVHLELSSLYSFQFCAVHR